MRGSDRDHRTRVQPIPEFRGDIGLTTRLQLKVNGTFNIIIALSLRRPPFMLATFTKLIRDEDGATLVEYALIVALIAVVAIAAISLLGKNASGTLNTAAGSI